MWNKLPIKDKLDLMRVYKKNNYSYFDMLDDYNKSIKQFSNGGKYLTVEDEYHRVYRNADGDIMVNHPREDKGKWDTINLTEESNARTIADGVSAVKKWHRENPNSYPNGGKINSETTLIKGYNLPEVNIINNKKVADTDSWLENAFEIIDPTGISSWDDVYRTYQNEGAKAASKEAMGAIPGLGKLSKLAKASAVTSRQVRSANTLGNINKLSKVNNAAESITEAANAKSGFNWDIRHGEVPTYNGRNIFPQINLEGSGDYAKGGMIKRADGSYSRRGLWDNIRVNKGSGKKPTPEMLEQERKIKAKYPDGGRIPIYSINKFNQKNINLNIKNKENSLPISGWNEPVDWLGEKYNDVGLNFNKNNLNIGIGNYIPRNTFEKIGNINPYLNMSYDLNDKNSIGGSFSKDYNGVSFIHKFDNGGKKEREPIYVTDKNDPRIRPYIDSLAAYNISKKNEALFDKNPGDPLVAQYNKQGADLTKRTGIQPVSVKGSLGWTQPYRKEDLAQIEDAWIAKFKKPVQPYIYRKEEEPKVKLKEQSKQNFKSDTALYTSDINDPKLKNYQKYLEELKNYTPPTKGYIPVEESTHPEAIQFLKDNPSNKGKGFYINPTGSSLGGIVITHYGNPPKKVERVEYKKENPEYMQSRPVSMPDMPTEEFNIRGKINRPQSFIRQKYDPVSNRYYPYLVEGYNTPVEQGQRIYNRFIPSSGYATPENFIPQYIPTEGSIYNYWER